MEFYSFIVLQTRNEWDGRNAMSLKTYQVELDRVILVEM